MLEDKFGLASRMDGAWILKKYSSRKIIMIESEAQKERETRAAAAIPRAREKAPRGTGTAKSGRPLLNGIVAFWNVHEGQPSHIGLADNADIYKKSPILAQPGQA